jgi:general secretion pathway protein J
MRLHPVMAFRNHGMTLIELLIAMAIFAVMTASMFIAFDSFQKGKVVTEASAERLKRYQLAFNILARDMQQIISRPVRDEFGSDAPLYSMRSDRGGCWTELKIRCPIDLSCSMG